MNRLRLLCCFLFGVIVGLTGYVVISVRAADYGLYLPVVATCGSQTYTVGTLQLATINPAGALCVNQ